MMKSSFKQLNCDRNDFLWLFKEVEHAICTPLHRPNRWLSHSSSLIQGIKRSGLITGLVSTIFLGFSGNSAIAAQGCPTGQVPFAANGNADSQTSSQFFVGDPDNALGSSDGNVATLRSVGQLTLNLTDLIPENATVTITLTRANTNGEVRIEASADGVNFSGALTYGDSGDIPAGPVGALETINYTVPAGGARYIRFQGSSLFSQMNIDAVSYSLVCRNSVDYGDAPAAYGTLDSDNGPNHIIVAGLQLGSLVDTDTDGFGNGVDNNGNAADDSPGDDGVTTFARLYDDSFDDIPLYNVNINVTNTTGGAANLVGWIDFDGNSQFDANESVTASVPDGTNGQSIPLLFTIPNDIQAGTTYARFRLTTDGIDGNDPLGAASDGEVEDYVLTISSALPLPTNLNCGAPISFPWEGNPGGFIWNVDDTANTYSISGVYDVDITLLDPSNQNLDTGNPGTFSPPGYTRSAGVFGAGKLTWSMTSANDAQTVTLQITFSEPTVLNDMTIVDIDGISVTAFNNAGFSNSISGSFQDEMSVSASFRGSNVPINLAPAQAGLMSINGQTARGGYANNFSTSLSSSDPLGHLQLSTTAAIDTLILEYSNGPADAAADGSGVSDDHSVAIDLWTFCEAFPEIRGVVWDDDADGDGIRDIGESGVGGVGVELYDAADRNNPNAVPIAVTTTAFDGAYEFMNQRPSDFFIRFIQPLDKGFTLQDQGLDDSRDSDPDTTTGETADFTLTSGVDQSGLDAGLATTTVASNPNVLLVKRITLLNGGFSTTNGDNLAAYTDDPNSAYDDNTITITTDPVNPGDPAKDTDQWPDPATFLVGGIDGGDVRPDDELEYTIYFLSSGDATAQNVLVCDRVPDFVDFIPDIFNVNPTADPTGNPTGDRGIVLGLGTGASAIAQSALTNEADGDIGFYFPPGEEPTVTFPNINCGGLNTNGAVVVNLGDLPNTTSSGEPAGSYGFVRFRARVR